MKLIILFCVLLPLIYGQGLQEDPPDDVGSRRGKRSPQGLLDNTEIRVNGFQEDPPDDVGSRRGKRSPQGLLDNTEIRVNGLQEDPPDDVGSRRGKRSPQGFQEDPPDDVGSRRGKRSPQGFQEDPPDDVGSRRGKRSPQGLLDNTEIRVNEIFDDKVDGVEFENRGKRSAELPAGAGLIRMARRSNGDGRRQHGVAQLDSRENRANRRQEDPPEEVGLRRGKRSPQGLLDNTEIRVEFENRGKRSPELFDNNNNGVEFESIPRAAGLIRRARCANPPPSALKQGRREHDPIELSAVTFIPPPYPLF